MAKTYMNVGKYQINVKFEIKGIVDKHDIVGAIFGQSEGLVGEEMDLKELQKNGRVGRIEVEPKTSFGKTYGTLIIPSSMDMVETSILAAAVESVDKVGPCEAEFQVTKIEDTRSIKRKEIIERAKQLLETLMTDEIPETQEIAEEVKSKLRIGEIEEIGIEKIPAGPEVKTSDSLIIVEGRADVLTLLKNGIRNVIGMNGSKAPPALTKICKGKTITAFVDGDRGGDINIKNLKQVVEIDFVAKAPDGKEVEELTRKEILASLRKKIPLAQYHETTVTYHNNNGRPLRTNMPIQNGYKPQNRPRYQQQKRYERNDNERYRDNNEEREKENEKINETQKEQWAPTTKNEEDYKEQMEKLKNTLTAKMLDEKGKEIKETKVRELVKTLKSTKGVKTIIFDGIITKRLLDEAEKQGVTTIVGARKGKFHDNKKIKTIAMEE